MVISPQATLNVSRFDKRSLVPILIKSYIGVKVAPTTAPTVVEPCNPSPCEVNSRCEVSSSGAPVCVCLPGFTGSAQLGCRPECLSNSECPAGLSCVNRRCQDPCPGLCGNQAKCSVASHMPFCNCPVGFTGDPYSSRGCQILPCKTYRSIF